MAYSKTYRVAIIGATGVVGRKLCEILSRHPNFQVTALAASARSAGKTYQKALSDKYGRNVRCPSRFADLPVWDASADFEKIVRLADFAFCAVNMDRFATKALEERFALSELPVISNNSANRLIADVPIIIPEVNPSHLSVIPLQRKRLGTKRGFIATKSNCSIQTFAPLLKPLLPYKITSVAVCTYQAVSGMGKSLFSCEEIQDNVIPYIPGEEEKCTAETLKIFGNVLNGNIVPATTPKISAQCVRVPVSDGHTAAVFVSFENKPDREEIISSWNHFKGEPQLLRLHSAPAKLIRYFYEDDRPQPKLDRNEGNGMSVCVGRLREDSLFDYKFISLAHNTIRGAAGGSVLLAELLAAKGYLE